jgi:hypothetical protein
MPTFGDLITQINKAKPALVNELRLQYMQQMVALTKRPLVVYYARPEAASTGATVGDQDMLALMECLYGIKGRELDLIIDSDGGSPDTADAFVAYLRAKFDHVRVFVPHRAMSAATMIACGADEIWLAAHSFLGPIDVQLNGGDGQLVAAQDVLDQAALIKQDFEDPKAFWGGPGLLYHPTLLILCQNVLDYGRELAERHLAEVMFRGHPEGADKARIVAEALADHRSHKHHGRRLSRKYLQGLGLNIKELESDQALQEVVLTISHCFRITFVLQPKLMKLVQNHDGRLVTVVDRAQGFTVPAPVVPVQPAPQPAPPPAPDPVVVTDANDVPLERLPDFPPTSA